MTKPRVLISDALSPAAVQIFRDRGIEVDFQPNLGKDKEKLAEIIGDYDGLAIRSATKATAKILERATRLKVIGRAGIGVDNVEIPLLYRRMSNSERRKAALAALDRVGLSSRTHHFPTQLSGGQQQRVAIARAIVGKPGILLADEPTGNLDSQMGDEIMDILSGLNVNEGTTIVMVTHDPRMAEKTHRVVRMFDGRQVQ